MERKPRRKKEVGRWTRQQHARFVHAIIKFGKNWKEVQEAVSTRTTAQVRSHAQKFFNRLTKEQRSILLPYEMFEDEGVEEEKPEEKEVVVKQEEGVKKQELKSINDMEGEDSSSSDSESEGEMRIQPRQGPPYLVEIIKKSSNEGKDKVGVKQFIQKLNSESESINQNIIKKKSSSDSQEIQEQIRSLQRSKNHVTNLSNLLIAYITLSESEETQDESFFLTLLRRQRKYIYRNQFFKLIDLPIKQESKTEVPTEARKKSFSLIECEPGLNSSNGERMGAQGSKKEESPSSMIVQSADEPNCKHQNLN